MKIKIDNDERMVVEYRPIGTAILFACATLVALSWGFFDISSGGYTGYFFILIACFPLVGIILLLERSTIIMDARAGTVDIRRISMFKRSHHIYTIDEVSRFGIERTLTFRRHKHRTSPQEEFRLRIIVDEGEAEGHYPLTDNFNPTLDKTVATRANDWLRRARENAPAQTANSAAATLLPSDKSTL